MCDYVLITRTERSMYDDVNLPLLLSAHFNAKPLLAALREKPAAHVCVRDCVSVRAHDCMTVYVCTRRCYKN